MPDPTVLVMTMRLRLYGRLPVLQSAPTHPLPDGNFVACSAVGQRVRGGTSVSLQAMRACKLCCCVRERPAAAGSALLQARMARARRCWIAGPEGGWAGGFHKYESCAKYKAVSEQLSKADAGKVHGSHALYDRHLGQLSWADAQVHAILWYFLQIRTLPGRPLRGHGPCSMASSIFGDNTATPFHKQRACVRGRTGEAPGLGLVA